MENPSITTEHFLVYGTLRPGCGNYDHYFPYVAHSVRTVRIPGFAMYGVRGFPYAVRGKESDSIECTLVTVTDTPDNVLHLTKGLDFLEGYDEDRAFNHYDRIQVDVEGVTAHMYVANDGFRDKHVLALPPLLSGNWHDVAPADGGAYMWVYEGEDASIVPDFSVEARFVSSAELAEADLAEAEAADEDENSIYDASFYETNDYADVDAYYAS